MFFAEHADYVWATQPHSRITARQLSLAWVCVFDFYLEFSKQLSTNKFSVLRRQAAPDYMASPIVFHSQG